MDGIFVALAVAAFVLFLWLRDRQKGEAARHPHGFQRQDTRQTLREGLEEFYDAQGLLPPRTLSKANAASLRAHDVAHVVFGCDDSTRGEIVLTRWSFLGAKHALPVYIAGLRSSETRWLFGEFFRKVRPLPLLLGVVDGFQALWRSLRMTARWPSEEWERYLDRPLAEIRGEYNIRIV